MRVAVDSVAPSPAPPNPMDTDTEVDSSPATVDVATVDVGLQVDPIPRANDRKKTIESLVEVAGQVGKVYDFCTLGW